MPYLSHPVRRIRNDPTAGEDVSLLLGFDEEDGDPPVEAVEAVAAAVADASGSVDRQLEYATIEVTVPEHAVPRLCEIDGLSHVETSGTLGLAVATVAGPVDPDGDASDTDEPTENDGDEAVDGGDEAVDGGDEAVDGGEEAGDGGADADDAAG